MNFVLKTLQSFAPLRMSGGIPRPLLRTEISPFSRSIQTLISFMFLSRCLLSAALTRISSKILYRPGVRRSRFFGIARWRCPSWAWAEPSCRYQRHPSLRLRLRNSRYRSLVAALQAVVVVVVGVNVGVRVLVVAYWCRRLLRGCFGRLCCLESGLLLESCLGFGCSCRLLCRSLLL
ncbi:hypothetical protein KCV00_g232, partial [Aureobasidium melanogenum]